MLGIHTGSTQGIHTGSVLGIHTGSTQGIHTGSVRGIHTGSVVGVYAGSSINGQDDSFLQLVLSAPISAIDYESAVIESAGQKVFASREMISSLTVGDVISVFGTVAGPGFLYADAVVKEDIQYVPGSTPIIVAGIPSETIDSAGLTSVGDMSVDVARAVGVSAPKALRGIVTVVGVESQPGSALLTGELLFESH